MEENNTEQNDDVPIEQNDDVPIEQNDDVPIEQVEKVITESNNVGNQEKEEYKDLSEEEAKEELDKMIIPETPCQSGTDQLTTKPIQEPQVQQQE